MLSTLATHKTPPPKANPELAPDAVAVLISRRDQSALHLFLSDWIVVDQIRALLVAHGLAGRIVVHHATALDGAISPERLTTRAAPLAAALDSTPRHIGGHTNRVSALLGLD